MPEEQLSSCYILTAIATILKITFNLHSKTQKKITKISKKYGYFCRVLTPCPRLTKVQQYGGVAD